MQKSVKQNKNQYMNGAAHIFKLLKAQLKMARYKMLQPVRIKGFNEGLIIAGF